MAFSAERTRGTKVLFPMELFPVYFLVIRMGSQFRTLDSSVRKVVPSVKNKHDVYGKILVFGSGMMKFLTWDVQGAMFEINCGKKNRKRSGLQMRSY